MSGFARGLAARARGGDGAVLRAHRAPRFVPATGSFGGEPPSERGLPTAIDDIATSRPGAAQAPADRDDHAATTRDARPATASTPMPARGASRKRRPPSSRRILELRDPREGDTMPALPAPMPARAEAPVPAEAAAEVVHAAAPAPQAAATVRSARRAPTPSPASTAATIRTARRPPGALPATTASAPAPPRVEVHIGRVEVSAPRPVAAPPQRALRAPAAPGRHGAAASQPGSAFGELAAARRHVDRLAR